MYQNIILVVILFLLLVLAALVVGRYFNTSLISIFGGKSAKLPYYKDLKKHPRSKAEENVINILEKLTGESFPTVYPPWLVYNKKHLELDGYNDKLKIAIEFSGPQHTKWYPNKEPYEKYYNRIKNDEAKIKICKKHGVELIVVDKLIPRHNLHVYLKSRLYDLGVIKNAPVNYMPPTLVKPDVNLQLEEEIVSS